MYGGTDKEENIITLCGDCHKFSPDNPHKLIEYLGVGVPLIAWKYISVLIPCLELFLKDNCPNENASFLTNKFEEHIKTIIKKGIDIFNETFTE